MNNGIEPPEWAKEAIRRSHGRMVEAMRFFHTSMGGSEETFQAILAAQGMAPEGRGREGGPGSSELPSPVAAGDAPKGESS